MVDAERIGAKLLDELDQHLNEPTGLIWGNRRASPRCDLTGEHDLELQRVCEQCGHHEHAQPVIDMLERLSAALRELLAERERDTLSPGARTLYDDLSRRLIGRVLAADADCDPPEDVELRLVAIICERDRLRAERERYEAASITPPGAPTHRVTALEDGVLDVEGK